MLSIKQNIELNFQNKRRVITYTGENTNEEVSGVFGSRYFKKKWEVTDFL